MLSLDETEGKTTLKPLMHTALEGIHLEDTGIVRVSGVDAVKFLQGQLSSDVAKLGPGQSQLAGYHNPQGRTIAILRLVQWSTDDILALVPRELAAVVAARLAKYVLRAKVKVVDESAQWRVVGLVGAEPRGDSAMFVRVGDQPPRWLAVGAASFELDYAALDRAAWLRLEVAAGQPQVYAATSEEFVAQMLNLDALDAIAFDKGCYTGQEVIARAHYRGRVKRRMQRFVSRRPLQLAPGDAGELPDGRSFKVVLSAPLADGRCDFLAVTSVGGGGEGAAGSAAAAMAGGGGAAGSAAATVAGDGGAAGSAAAAMAGGGGAVGSAAVAVAGGGGAAAAAAGGAAGASAAPVAAEQVALPYPLPE